MIDFGYGVSLAPIFKDALGDLKNHRNNIAIRRWCRQYGLITDYDQEKWYEKIHEDQTIAMYLPSITSDSINYCAVGVCGLTSIDRVNQNAEFSLYIFPKFQGNGYAKSSLKTLLHHGFYDHNLNRIWGETYDGNPALALFHKLGMVTEGTLRQAYFREGKFIDCHVISMLRDNFPEIWESWQ